MRHSSFLEVNLDYLAQNYSQIQLLAPKAKILPMVKADAYGNGLIVVSRFLVEKCGAKKLGVATLGEALRLFEECPDLKAEVLVFSDTELQNKTLCEAYLNLNIIPVLHQISDLEVVLKDPDFKKVPVVIKLNTGMNRLGMNFEEIEPYLPLLKARGIEHLMTHFATSYYVLKDGDKTNRQYTEFKRIKKLLEGGGITIKETSVANSGAIEQKFGIEETYVRPGLMLYGPPSVEEQILWRGHQISRLVTKALKTTKVKKGTPVGYGINVAGADGFMVIIALGYGDGLMTFASGVKLMVNGFEARFFARVNMDMAYLMFDPSVEGKIKAEDQIEIWNHDNRVITDLATQMKTIPYQIMCGISGRIPRVYKVK